MQSEPDPNYMPEFFVTTEESPIQFADNFKVRWIIQCNQMFNYFDDLPTNPMNEDLPIKQSKNGQELPFKLGNYLCYLLYNSKQSDLQTKVLCPISEINFEFTNKQQ